MGNCCDVEGAVDHWVYVKVGDRKIRGSDATLRVIVHDVKGRQSPEITIKCPYKAGAERGQEFVAEAGSLYQFDDLDRIELWREGSSPGPDLADFYCQAVVINDRSTERWYYFPVQRWLEQDSSKRYKIKQFDTSIPNNYPHKEERAKELENKRELYQYGQTAAELPVQVGMLPPYEQFSDEYKHDIINTHHQLLSNRGIIRPSGTNWTSLTEVTSIYSAILPQPLSVGSWSSDVYFGAQRVRGCNPLMIKLCSQLPENMGVTADMLRPFLEGWTLKQIIDAKRLFLVDFKILDKIPTLNDRPLCVPLGLFFVTGDKQLVPIAIQLFQHIAPNNPVFLPNDPPFTWILAKMWFNNADAAVHQALCHFGYTHLLMESACVSIHRQLSPIHPIFKLLAPHLLFLPAINARGLDQLWSQGAYMDRTTALGREGMIDLIRRGIDDWRMDIHGTFPKELESRGLLDPKVLPNYPFRDDGMLLYKAIDNYVSKIVRYYYDSFDKINADVELQNWMKELITPKEDNGCGLRGVPGNGKFRRAEDIIMVCTSIIFTCSVLHSAVNYPQYNEYGFPPNYPTRLKTKPPTDRSPVTEEDIVAALPDKQTSFDVITMSKIFSEPTSKGLADWEFQFHYDPPALKAEKEFREELLRIKDQIDQRNRERLQDVQYEYLLPERVANNVSI